KRPGDVNKDIARALPVLGGEAAAQVARDVAEPAADFQDDLGLPVPPAELLQLLRQQAPVGKALHRLAGLPEQVRHGGLDGFEVALRRSDLVRVEVREMGLALELRGALPALPDLQQKKMPAGVAAIAGRRLGPEIAQGIPWH